MALQLPAELPAKGVSRLVRRACDHKRVKKLRRGDPDVLTRNHTQYIVVQVPIQMHQEQFQEKCNQEFWQWELPNIVTYTKACECLSQPSQVPEYHGEYD